jgi:tetratricopeptide (TPR) repeat protein
LHRVFVSRDKELQQLDDRLKLTLQGNGQVSFVTGEAGFGKTTLATEFAQRAQQCNEDLLVVIGDCNAQTGIGDPYLPFREVLAMLAGDTHDRVAQGMTTAENAGRLKRFLDVSKRAILDLGPDLLDIFLPGFGIATRAGALVVGEKENRSRESLADNVAGLPRSDSSHGTEQSRVFEQVTSVLTTLACQKPLILILDDLKWADESSASLLFHLARRIDGSRIQIIGTYRPEEVAVGRGEARHPVEGVVSELKRQYGDPLVVLGDETASETRDFVDALVDTEPNKLDEAFRSELHKRTNGHALFTAELLLEMQERGDLTQDTDGDWTEGPTLDWGTLPARVEGVVEERINRLESELREMLTIASVEGETFTAQVIGRLQEIAERRLLNRLSQELDRQHRLISEESSKRVGESRISHFRFRHHVFQKFLYDNLGDSEREQLHEDVADVLEALYECDRSRVSVQLAHHYERAGLYPKSAECYLLAGKKACDVYAYNESLGLAERGLAVLGQLGDLTDQSELVLELNLLLGEAHHHVGHFAESMDTFEKTAEMAAALEAPEALARAALGYDEPRWRCNLLEGTAIDLLRRALDMLDDGDSELRVRLMSHLARASLGSAPKSDLKAMLDNAVAMARRLEEPGAFIESLRTRLNLDREPGGIDTRVRLIDEMLPLAMQIDDKCLQIELLAYRVYDLVAIGDTVGRDRDLEALRQISVDIAEPFYEYMHETMAIVPVIDAGRFESAEQMAMAAFETGQKLGVDNNEGVMGVQMFTIRREQGRLAEIAPIVRHFVNERGAGAAWRPGLALIYADLGQPDEARAEFEQLSRDGFESIPRDSLWQTSLVYLAETCCVIGASDKADTLYGLLSPFGNLAVVVGNASVCLGATSRYLGQLAVEIGRWDDAESHFRHAVEFDERTSAAAWLAHSQFKFGQMLLRRGRPKDVTEAESLLNSAMTTAISLGMHSLKSRIKASTGDA